MRGPYGKLWTEFFPSFYGPSAKRAGHENREGKKKDPYLAVRIEQTRLAGHENREGKNKDPYLAVRIEQTRLIRCLLYGFVDYSGFEKVIEN